MNVLDYTHFYLVGIKGVAMTALAQCLIDAGKSVRGSDVAEEFVTQPLLDKLSITIDFSFGAVVPPETECVIYTSAHGAQLNPQVEAARQKNIPVLSHAEALASLFNQKKGIAVCGVGGKSTTSAMIVWILEKTGHSPSFAVGVGNIPGLNRTGAWREESEFFVAEADEYVVDPSAPSRGEKIVPRFSFLNPVITVCTNLKFDHPDVYKDFVDTQQTYLHFFEHMKPNGTLIMNEHDRSLVPDRPLQTFGTQADASFQLSSYTAKTGTTTAQLHYNKQTYTVTLIIPGIFNMHNAAAAIAACHAAGIPIEDSITALSTFPSTKRRFEFIGEKNGVKYYDDYAHHPSEIEAVIEALTEWYPTQRKVLAFQSHTFSRTRELFDEFVQSFHNATDVVMIDIFPSAREIYDPGISSDMLCAAIHKRYPHIKAHNVQTIENLAQLCRAELKPGDVFMTVGAGDIYKVHDLL